MSTGTEHTRKMAYELAQRPLAQVIVETGLLVVIALTALVGNSCVLYVFYKSPGLRTITSYYIISLAISDISMALVVMTTTIGTASCGRDVIGTVAGQVIGLIGYTLVFGSLQTTSMIALNRFFCVVKRSLYKRYFKPKLVLITIVGLWIVSLSNTVVFYASGLATIEFFPGRFVHLLAFKDKTTNEIFALFSLNLFCCLPISLTGVCYWKVYKAVKGHNASVSSTINSTNKLSKEEIDITKSVLALVFGFVLCWIPCSVVVILSVYVNLPRYADMVFTYTAYLSSAINPIIFNVFNKPFRSHLKQLLLPSRVFPDESETATHSTSNRRSMTK